MIRKLLLLLLLIAAFSPLSAALSFPLDIGAEDEAFLSSCFSSAIGGRKDVSIEVTSFERSEEYIQLTFLIEGEERTITASNDEEVKAFIGNALSLEELLYLDGSTLFYVTDDIIASHDSYLPGTFVEAYDVDGRTRALLEVTDSSDGVNLYSSIYEKDLKAGLSLRRGPSFSLSLRGVSNISFSSFSFALDFSYLPLFSYFNPVLSLYVSYDGSFSYYGGLGVEGRLPLERLIRTHFTLIEDASIVASVMLYLGYDGAFSLGSGFAVAYEHHMTSRFYWRVGYETSTMIPNTMMLSFGVMI